MELQSESTNYSHNQSKYLFQQLNSTKVRALPQLQKLNSKQIREKSYYQEGSLIKNAQKFNKGLKHCFSTSIMENISLIKNALDEKKVQESLKQIDQRTENAQKYFNQDFRMPISQTHNNSPMNKRIGEVLQLERSISKVRDAKNEVFINDEEKLNHDRSVFSSPKIRKAMGVFSDYEVQLHQQNEQKINNIYHLDQSQQNTGRGNDGKISTEVARFNTLI